MLKIQQVLEETLSNRNKQFSVKDGKLMMHCPNCYDGIIDPKILFSGNSFETQTLNVDLETGNYECKKCGKKGDINDFLINICQISKEQTAQLLDFLFSIENYAENVSLPIDFLKELGVKSGTDNTVIIPYYGENNEEIAIKCISKNGEFKWSSRFKGKFIWVMEIKIIYRQFIYNPCTRRRKCANIMELWYSSYCSV